MLTNKRKTFILEVTFLIFTSFPYPIVSQGQLIYGVQIIPDRWEATLRRDLSNTKTDIEKLTVLLKLGNLYLNKRYPKSKSLEQALYFSREALSLSKKVHSDHAFNEAQLLIGLTFMRQGNIDSAIYTLNNANDSIRFDLSLSISFSYRLRGLNTNDVEMTKKAIEYAALAKKISDTLGDPEKQILADRAIVCIKSDKEPVRMIPELLGFIKKLQTVHYPYLHYTYFELVGSEASIGNYDKALYYSFETLKSMGQTRDSSLAGDFLWGHSFMLRLASRHEESVYYAKLAIDQFKHSYGIADIPSTIFTLVDEMSKLKKINEAEIYVKNIERTYSPETLDDSIRWTHALGQLYRIARKYPIAENYLLQKFQLEKRSGHVTFNTYHSIGQFYIESNNYPKGKIYLTKALALVDSTVSLRTLGHLHYCLFLADSATGNYLSAIQHLSKTKRYDDTLLTRSKTESIQKYLTQFETSKKEDSLKQKDQLITLLQQRNDLQQVNLKQANLIKNITIVGIVFTLVLLGVLYYQFRRNQKSNKIILQKSRQLEEMLAEKEWWLKEVHHRVKNNLHTIISLLESQAMYLEKDALHAIETSQHRIYAMSLIHQKLYQNDDVKSIDMSVYLEDFLTYLKESFDTRRIEFITKVEAIQLNLQQAIPTALIINEAVTNSIKYAFSEIQDPKIFVSMYESEGSIHLIIADNGRGFVLTDEIEAKSLGIQLIRGLSKEIRGALLIQGTNGAKVTIHFKKDSVSSEQIPKELASYEA